MRGVMGPWAHGLNFKICGTAGPKNLCLIFAMDEHRRMLCLSKLVICEDLKC